MGQSRLLAMVLALSGLLSACGPSGTSGLFTTGTTITVLAELSTKADPLEQAKVEAMLQKQIKEFKRINPRANISFRGLPSDRLEQEVIYRTKRGLGPDLMLLASNRDLINLRQEGYISPVALSSQEQNSFKATYLKHLRQGGQQLAVPLLVFPPLACFDRRRLPQSPQTLAAIIRFGVTLLPEKENRPSQQERMLKALQWYREANLQPDISFVESDEELRQGLQAGRFEWIPCSSGWIPTLQRALGANLGIAVLPAGTEGVAKPLLRMPMWAFGAQSSPRQRQLAKRFVMFTGNVVNQRSMALKLGTVLPVNPTIALPLKAYPNLAVMDAASRNATMTTVEQRHFLLQNEKKLESLIAEVLAGVQSPNAVAPKIQSQLNAMTSMGSQP